MSFRANLIGFPHSFCSDSETGSSVSERAEEEDISEMPDAVDVIVEERGREVMGSEGGGRGTDSTIVCASLKMVCRYSEADGGEVGTVEKSVGARDLRAVWRAAIVSVF